MKTMLKDHLDWEKIMKAPRYAGGHEEVMEVLFKDAEVIAYYIEPNYDGSEAFVYCLNNEYILVTDYFGSCSGCDAWEDAPDEEARNMCIALANNARRFDSLNSLISFLDKDVKEEKGTYYAENTIADQLLVEIRKNITHMRDVKIDDILEN